MSYLVPFSVLKGLIRVVSIRGELKLDMTYDQLMDMIRRLLMAVPVDEAWYRRAYPDVAEAIEAGTYRSARQHFLDNGYLEGRRPFAMEVDEGWYLKAYPDLKAAIAQGVIASATEHFVEHGYEEGRLPGPLHDRPL